MSDLKFNCPHCQQRLGVPEAALGRRILCPSCEGPIQLPERGKPQTEPAASRPVSMLKDSSEEGKRQKGDIKFSCPSCEAHLVIEERGAGKQISCPYCGAGIHAPLATPLVPSDQPAIRQVLGKVDMRQLHELVEKTRTGDEQAKKALIEMGAPVIPVLVEGLKEDTLEEPNLSRGADYVTDLLVAFGAQSVQPLIAKLGKSRHAYYALGRTGNEEAIRALVRELSSCNWRRVELACAALGLVENPSVLKVAGQLDKLRKSTRSGEVYTAAGDAVTAINNRFRTHRDAVKE